VRDGSPRYRIGIALLQSQTKDHEDDGDDEEDDEEDEDEDEDEDEMDGLVIENVLDDSPAKEAGVQSGDVVVKVNGKKVKVVTDMQETIQNAGKNEKAVVLELLRKGKEITVSVKPTKTEEPDPSMVDLSLVPEGGNIVPGRAFVFRGDGQHIAPLEGVAQVPGMPMIATWNSAADEGLKKEIQNLKSEIAELKEMIKKLIEK
jgi:serine protease DegQ